jgi:phosphoserine phosphatase RsbU/P
MRRGKSSRILIWLGIWSGTYGIRLLFSSSAIIVLFPHMFQLSIPFINNTISYLILVFALFTWLDLTRSKFHLYMQSMIFVGLAIAMAGIGWFIVKGKTGPFMLYNNLLAAVTIIILLIVVTVRKLSDKFLVLPNRGVLAVGTFLFAAVALYSNLSRLFVYQTYPIFGWLGFAALLFSLAYVAAEMTFASERRLFAIENELETARQIQASILPASVPELDNLSIVAKYHPMAAVAGDFYEFISVDSKHAGFLVADVSGHGVPAALIASMIKIAIQSVVDLAHDPGEVMRRLNKILGNQLQGQFVTAAYLYIDLTTYQAKYSAAGHPPLLYWDSAAGQTQYIESNGLPLGVSKDVEYPVLKFTFNCRDRFLLYTDGLIEAENSDSEAFGDRRLSEVIRSNENTSTVELGDTILKELTLWQRTPKSQQDDVTCIIIDVK